MEDGGLYFIIYEASPGWKIVVERIIDNKWVIVEDRWEESIQDIPRYFSKYTSSKLSWTEQVTGVGIDLTEFVRKHSG